MTREEANKDWKYNEAVKPLTVKMYWCYTKPSK